MLMVEWKIYYKPFVTGQSAPPLHVLYAECGTHLKRLAQAATHFAAGELLSLAFD